MSGILLRTRLLVALAAVLVGAGSFGSWALAEDYQAVRSQLNTQDQKAAEVHSHIQNLDAQIALIESQIADTNAKIADTNIAIAAAQKRMAAQQTVLKEYIQAEYKRSDTSGLELLASSKDFSDFFDKSQYIEAGKEKITTAVEAIIKIKKQLDTESARLAVLDKQLADQQNGLVFARAQSQNQLAAIESARAALQTKLAAMRNGGMPFVGERISGGEVIGYEGTSGCSTGSHLHFEVQRGGSPVNPRNYMGGALQWPFASFGVNQEFGPPNWGAPYSFHTGIDITQYFGAPVHAAGSGTVIFSGYDRSGFGDHVIIDHGNGLRTIYGHMGGRASDYPYC